MRILMIPSWYPPNGGMFFVHQAQGLVEKGIDVAVIVAEEKGVRKFSFRKSANDFRVTKNREFGILTYRKTQWRIPKINRLNTKLWINLAFRLSEIFIHENSKPDLILVQSCMWAGYVAAKIKKKYKIPYVIIEHRGRFNKNDYFGNKDIRTWHLPLLKEALTQADAIIPVSEMLVSTLNRVAGKELNCIPCPNPVDESFFEPAPSEVSSWKETVFLNISNFLPYKAISILIHAFRLACLKTPDLRLHLVGDGPERQSTEKMVLEMSLKDRVIFYGIQEREGIKENIQGCDFLVLSSFNEGQPVIIGEATMCGKPVICTDVISKADVPDFAGLIVPAGDIEALAEAMLFAHEHRTEFNAGKIRTFAQGRFSQKVVITEIIRAMESVISSYST
jgi:glycosyltransferase involved in cell wall biosynthesis